MGFTLFGEEYKYEVDSINIGIFCPDGTLLIVLKLKDGTYKSIDVNLGAEKYKSLCKENDITNNVPVLVTQEHVNKLDKEIKIIKDNFRNPAAHKNSISMLEASACIDYILEIERVLKYMLEMFNF